LYLEQHQNSDSFQTLLVGGCSIPKPFIMTDNKNKKDARDRNQVAGGESYEVDYLAKELGVTRQQVEEAIKNVGNGREDVKNYLKNKK